MRMTKSGVCGFLRHLKLRHHLEYENIKHKREHKSRSSLAAVTRPINLEQGTQNTEVQSVHQCETGK